MSKIFSGYRSPGARTEEQVQAERGEIEKQYIDPQAPKKSLIDEAIDRELTKDTEVAPTGAPRTIGVGQGAAAQVAQQATAPTLQGATPRTLEETQVDPKDLDTPVFSATGQELSPSEKLKLQQREQERAKDAVSAPGAVDITNLGELDAGFKGIVSDSNQGQVQQAAKDFIEGLTEINYSTPNVNESTDVTAEGQTGLNLIQQQTGIDNRAIPLMVTSGLAALSQELRGQQAIDDSEAVDVSVPEDATGFEQLETLEETGTSEAIRGLKVEDFRRRAAKHMKQFLTNQAIARGEDPATINQVNADVMGVLAEQTATRDNIYFKYGTDKNGNKIITLSTKGLEFSDAANKLQQATAQPTKGFRSKVPVNADTGWYNNRLKEVRKQRLKKGPRDNQKRKQPKEILNYQVVLGSSGYTSTTGQIGGTLLLNLLAHKAEGELKNTASNLLQIGPKRIRQLSDKAIDGGRNPERQVDRELSATVKKLNSSINTYTDIITSGEADYNPHKEDPTVSRMYGENTAVEIQGNLFNRQLANDNQNVYIKVDDKALTRLTQLNADDVWEYFARHDSDGGNTADRSMQLVEQLILAHKNIAGDKTQKMSWENRYNEATNPQFYLREAETGKQLKSAISKLNLLNENGSVNPDVLSTLLVQTDKEGNIPRGPDYKPVYQITAELPSFTEAESLALNRWLNNSSKKDYGFKLSSYLALADLVDAKTNEGHWKPKQMGDMDMNSAGRSFVSNDLGSEATLNYTLLTDSFLNEKNNPEVASAGGPRSLFRKQITDILKDSRENYKVFQNTSQAITPAQKEELSQSIINKMDNYIIDPDGRQEFEDDLGKYVQLVDDYGMPINMHQQSASEFLNKYEDIKEAMRPFYDTDGDMIVDFAKLYEQALRKSGTTWQGPMVKNGVKFLQHFGEHPEFKLMYGEDSFIGSESLREISDDDIVTIQGPQGEPISVKAKQLKKDFLGRKPSRDIKDYKTGKSELYDYAEGSLIVNQMGPILGQKRESYVLMGLANKINPDIKKPVVWMASVHDNIVTSGRGWLKMYVAANKKGGIVDEVFDFNHTEAFIDNLQEKMDKTILSKMSGIAKRGEKINIGRNGDYAFVMTQADEAWNKLQTKNLDDSTREYFEDMIKIYKAVGWKTPDERGDQGGVFGPKNFEVDPKGWLKPVEVTVNTPQGRKKVTKPALTALSLKYNLPHNVKKFRETKPLRDRINRRRRSERKSFIS